MHNSILSFNLRGIIACLALMCGIFAQGCASPSPPECKCDAAITKLPLEQPDAGGSALYGLVVNYSGHPSCHDGLLCVEDPLPTGLTCDPNNPAYMSPSATNPDWDCSCNGGSSVKCCYNQPLPPASTNLPIIQVPVLVALDAPRTVHNCASILQDFPGSFEDNTDANNTSCVDSKVLPCQSYHEHYLSGVIDNFAIQGPPESPSPSPDLLTWFHTYYGPTVRDYDATNSDQNFAHTFTNLVPQPGHFLAGGTLTLAVRCPQSNDAMSLRFTDLSLPSGYDPQIWVQYFYGAPLNVPCNPATTSTFTLDLNNLPPSLPPGPPSLTSVLSGITPHGFLDVTVQDDTGIDYLALDLDYQCRKKGGGSMDPTGVVTAMPAQAE